MQLYRPPVLRRRENQRLLSSFFAILLIYESVCTQADNIDRLRIGVRANIPDIAALFVKVIDQLIADCR